MADKEKGMFLPTTSVWDTGTIGDIKGISDDLKQLFIRLYRNINNIAIQVNKKDSAIYSQEEFVCGQIYFPTPGVTSASSVKAAPRQVYRKVVNFGALGNATTVSVPHGITITSSFVFTRIYGCASDTAAKIYLPLPYHDLSTANACIELWVDSTNVNIKVGTTRTSYNAYVVLEYLKH